MKDLNLLVWLSQLGISVAAPLAGCTLGSVWLRNHFQLGSWVLILGIILGLILAVDGFRTSLKAMERMSHTKKEDASAPPVSFNDHQ